MKSHTLMPIAHTKGKGRYLTYSYFTSAFDRSWLITSHIVYGFRNKQITLLTMIMGDWMMSEKNVV